MPRDEPSDEQKAERVRGVPALRLQDGDRSGKTTVMGMLAAWSILNKVTTAATPASPTSCSSSARTSRSASGWRELDPNRGEASLYRTRDLVPPHLMPDLRAGPRARHELARVRAQGDEPAASAQGAEGRRAARR